MIWALLGVSCVASFAVGYICGTVHGENNCDGWRDETYFWRDKANQLIAYFINIDDDDDDNEI